MPEGNVLDAASGAVVDMPGAQPALLAVARCAALCNDSTLYYDEVAGAPQHVGENTEVALRVLAEKVGKEACVRTYTHHAACDAAAHNHAED